MILKSPNQKTKSSFFSTLAIPKKILPQKKTVLSSKGRIRQQETLPKEFQHTSRATHLGLTSRCTQTLKWGKVDMFKKNGQTPLLVLVVVVVVVVAVVVVVNCCFSCPSPFPPCFWEPRILGAADHHMRRNAGELFLAWLNTITFRYACRISEAESLHPGRLTWTIIMEVWKIMFLSKWVICRFHVNLPGCKVSKRIQPVFEAALHIHHIPGLEPNQPAPRLLPVAHRQWNKPPAKKHRFHPSNYQHLYHQATFLGDVWMVRLGTPTGVSKWMETIQNWRYTITYLCSLPLSQTSPAALCVDSGNQHISWRNLLTDSEMDPFYISHLMLIFLQSIHESF